MNTMTAWRPSARPTGWQHEYLSQARPPRRRNLGWQRLHRLDPSAAQPHVLRRTRLARRRVRPPARSSRPSRTPASRTRTGSHGRGFRRGQRHGRGSPAGKPGAKPEVCESDAEPTRSETRTPACATPPRHSPHTGPTRPTSDVRRSTFDGLQRLPAAGGQQAPRHPPTRSALPTLAPP